MRVLDEVADAIRNVRGYTMPIRSSVVLEDVFDGQISLRVWSRLQRYLKCPLPPLEFNQGHWFRPEGFATVWGLVAHVASYRPDWERPTDTSEAAWQEAQIFVVVREVLVDAGNLYPDQVVRSARLTRELGLA